jgi:hypothetical protein
MTILWNLLAHSGGAQANQTTFGATSLEGGDTVLQGSERAPVTTDVDGNEAPRYGLPLNEDATGRITTKSSQVTISVDSPRTARGTPYVRP